MPLPSRVSITVSVRELADRLFRPTDQSGPETEIIVSPQAGTSGVLCPLYGRLVRPSAFHLGPGSPDPCGSEVQQPSGGWGFSLSADFLPPVNGHAETLSVALA